MGKKSPWMRINKRLSSSQAVLGPVSLCTITKYLLIRPMGLKTEVVPLKLSEDNEQLRVCHQPTHSPCTLLGVGVIGVE